MKYIFCVLVQLLCLMGIWEEGKGEMFLVAIPLVNDINQGYKEAICSLK